jgi:beta-galactosidase/beta-glucuronidase
MKCYIKDYPRPQFVRDSFKILNGNWDFCFDDQNQGVINKYFETFPQGTSILVPFTYESAESGIGDEKMHHSIWYHRIVTISKEDLNDLIYIHFEGSDYETQLWVNGIYIDSHIGGYERFSMDITNAIKVGDNDITIQVKDSFHIGNPRGKQRWRDDSFGCWYTQSTGIWKTVWLEYLPKEHLTHVKMTPDIDEQLLTLEYDITGTYDSNLFFHAVITYQNIRINEIIIPVRENQNKVTLSLSNTHVHEFGIQTWSPQSPNLYDISFTLERNNEVVDKVLSYFGMRKIHIEGDKILLNNFPYYERLILDQRYWKDTLLTPPDEESIIEDITKTKELGFNGARKHQKIEDERYLYWCDVKGLLVWSEMAATYDFSDYSIEAFTKEWIEIVKQNYNHPSIITWVPFNESWGILNVKNNVKIQSFINGIYYLTKSFDSTRPVVVNDGWEHTISDIITLHDYEEYGDNFSSRYHNIKEDFYNDNPYFNNAKTAFANGYSYGGQPIIISEYGGIALICDKQGWGYGNKVNDEEAYLRRYKDITEAIKKNPQITGFCYTQLTDVRQEINGILDESRNYKIDPKEIRLINLS